MLSIDEWIETVILDGSSFVKYLWGDIYSYGDLSGIYFYAYIVFWRV